MTQRVLLLSIKPEFAEMIFTGLKRAELRRIRPRLSEGDRVLVYVTAPVKALVGIMLVERIVSGAPSILWSLVKDSSGLTKSQFKQYYAGAAMGYAILLASVARLERPIGLETLRMVWSDFHPPQSYAYVSAGQLERIGV